MAVEKELRMENRRLDGAAGTIGERAVLQRRERTRLTGRRRPLEDAIRYLLFLCSAISILTTIGFVVVLGSESLRFFSQMGWINSNKRLVEAVSADDTVLRVAASGTAPTAGGIIRIAEEQMRIVEIVDAETLIVERGYNGTTPTEHPVEGTIFLGEQVSIVEFLTGSRWQPQIAEFGIWPLLTATLITTFMAMLVALPLGLGAAVYLSEYATPRVRTTLKPILELLAGIPTVVYGYFALTFMTPLLRGLLGSNTVQIYNMASAGLVMGIMIIPTVASMTEDALSAVPRSLREASYGLGATRLETTFRVLLPAALSGIIAAFLLAVSRAVGETMIVAIASGAGPLAVFDPFGRPLETFNPFQAGETITGHIARISTGDLSFNSIDYNSLFALGLALFIFTLILNMISGAISRRFREAYQ